MKRVYATLFAVLIAFIPIAASANGTTWLTVTMQDLYPQGHHFRVGVDAWAGVDVAYPYNYVVSNLGGLVDRNRSFPHVESGIIVNSKGIHVYMYTRSPGGTVFQSGCTPDFYSAGIYYGCIMDIPGLSLVHDQDIKVEDDYYPNSGYWVFWVQDTQGVYRALATYTTPNDYLTYVQDNQAAVYVGSNPHHKNDGRFNHPQTWLNPNWVDFSRGDASYTYTNMLDGLDCPNTVGIYPNDGDTHWWDMGTLTPYESPGICSGNMWVQ